MAKVTLQKGVQSRAATVQPQPSLIKRLAEFFSGKPASVGNRPISAKDNFSRRPPNHVYAPAKLQQMAQGQKVTGRPSDVLLTRYLSKVIVD